MPVPYGMLQLAIGLVVLVLLGSLVSSVLSSGRRRVGIQLAVLALGWAMFRYWMPLPTPFFILRFLSAGWIILIIIILVVMILVSFLAHRDGRLLGWVALAIALLAPFGDMFSNDMWWWAKTWQGMAALTGVAVLLAVLFYSSKQMFAKVMWATAAILALVLLLPFIFKMLGMHVTEIPANGYQSQSAGASDVGSSSPASGNPGATKTETADPNYKKLAQQLDRELKDKGLRPGEYTTDVDWSAHDPQNSLGFVGQTLEDRHDVVAFLTGDSEASVAARSMVQQAMEDKFDDPVQVNTEITRALTGECYIPVQFTRDMQYEGQPYYDDEVVLTPDGYRQAKPGDVLWLCMSTEGEVIWKASMRADCGNVGFTDIRPVRPYTPSVPPVTQPHGPKDSCPKVPGYQGPNSQCLQPKSPAPQPSGVSDPNEGTAGPAEPKPAPKPSPLAPSSSPSGGGDGSGGGASDGHSAAPSPEESGTQTGSPNGP